VITIATNMAGRAPTSCSRATSKKQIQFLEPTPRSATKTRRFGRRSCRMMQGLHDQVKSVGGVRIVATDVTKAGASTTSSWPLGARRPGASRFYLSLDDS